MSAVQEDSRRAGWNDVAHGILEWVPCEKWQSPLEWALHCAAVARDCRQQVRPGLDAYYDGVIAAAETYQATGKIERKRRLTTQELNGW